MDKKKIVGIALAVAAAIGYAAEQLKASGHQLPPWVWTALAFVAYLAKSPIVAALEETPKDEKKDGAQ